jgi:hypothetical protein
VKPYADARAAINVIGLAAMTGLPETWFLEGHFNFASLEALDTALNTAGFPRAAAAPDGGQDDVLDTTPASDIRREHLLFRVDPRLSYVSDDFAAANLPFWRGQTPVQ